MDKVLHLEDDTDYASKCDKYFENESIPVVQKSNIGDFITAYKKDGPFSCLLVDIKIEEKDAGGLEAINLTKVEHDRSQAYQFIPFPPIILLSAFKSDFKLRDLYKNYNIFHFHGKLEDKLADISNTIRNAFYHFNLIKRSFVITSKIKGKSNEIKKLLSIAERAAESDTSVLITGENGTGKELVATIIHELSSRGACPFVRFNCAAIPSELFESTFFGHEKGAFTGATEKQKGLFVKANTGTIFLDEVGDMTLNHQAKILRVLQERLVTAVGGHSPIPVDFRLISASNRPLRKLVDDGQFREDLFFRLNVLPINVCPLRERKEDIPLLVEYFLARHNQLIRRQRMPLSISEGAIKSLAQYNWPGNIRELDNIIQRVVALCDDVCDEADIENWLELVSDSQEDAYVFFLKLIKDAMYGEDTFLEYLEKCGIRASLQFKNNVQTEAAMLLGISRDTLRLKCKKYGIEIEK